MAGRKSPVDVVAASAGTGHMAHGMSASRGVNGAGGATGHAGHVAGTHGSSSKRLVMRPLKEPPKLPERFEDDTWAMLQAAMRAIYRKTHAASSLEDLYKGVENLCLQNMAERLYRRFHEECESHVKEEAVRLVKLSQELSTREFLTALSKCWADHCDQMRLFLNIFLHLDRKYVRQTPNLPSLWDLGLHFFRKHIIEAEHVNRKTVAGVIGLIDQERSGEFGDRRFIKSLLQMICDLGVYSTMIERPALEATARFYAAESQEFMRSADVPQYLAHVNERLNQEAERAREYLNLPTRKQCIEIVETQLLKTHVPVLLQRGLGPLILGSRKADLKLLYELLRRVGCLGQLRQGFASHLKQRGGAMVMDVEREKTLVEDLLALKSSIDTLMSECFASDPDFAHAFREAFEYFVNLRQNKPAELIAKYLDAKLRAGSKVQSDEELDQILDRVLAMFRYIQGKDVFEAFYKKDLAKRLLLGKSASIDAEKLMLAKLKAECGAPFTNKLEGMFKDIEISRDIMNLFNTRTAQQAPKAKAKLSGDVELWVNVLTKGFWPTYPPMEVKLPPDMAACQEVFKDFYLANHTGRKLMWQNSLGHCIVRAALPRGSKELSVSLFQTVVLLLFNNRPSLTYRDIADETGIEEGELKRTLQSLACIPNMRILNKNSKGKDIGDQDVFTVNLEFSHKLTKIKINSIQYKETKEENSATTERVFQDRLYQVDAAIVRIMKTRKTLSHKALRDEVFKQVKFAMSAQDLKARIESLIEREYLERTSDQDGYRYLA